jgi:hypothetical protein
MGPRKSIAVLLAAVVLIAMPVISREALAQEVGTATAVNPVSHGAKPGADLVALSVGARIVHKERIETTPSGTVQLLFLDKSTLSIGPNTNLLIDEFVYNPSAGTGHMVTSLAKGAFRYVGGMVSHQGDTTFKTTAAVIGIRGATVTVIHGPNGTRVINHYGVITIHNGCGTVVIRRSGFAVTVLDWNTCPGEPQRVTAAEIAQYLTMLTSRPGQDGGVPGFNNALLDRFGVGGLQGVIGPDTPLPTGNGESNAFQIIIQATRQGTGRAQPPPPPTPPPPPPPSPPSPPSTPTTTPAQMQRPPLR